MIPSVTPHLVGNTGLRALQAAIAEPERYAIEPKIDGVRGSSSTGPRVAEPVVEMGLPAG